MAPPLMESAHYGNETTRPDNASAMDGMVASVHGTGMVRRDAAAPVAVVDAGSSTSAAHSSKTTTHHPHSRSAAWPPPRMYSGFCFPSDAPLPSEWSREATDVLLCATCKRRLSEAGDLLDALWRTQCTDPAWLPRTRHALRRMLRLYEGIDGIASPALPRPFLTPTPLPSIYDGPCTTLFAQERALLAVVHHCLQGRDRPPPRTASLGAWLVRAMIVDCLSVHHRRLRPSSGPAGES